MSGLSVAIAGFLAFMALFAINWLRARSWLDPAVAISSVWALTFLFLAMAGGQLYGVSWTALLIYISGLAMFSLGVLLGNGIPVHAGKPGTYGYLSDRVILWLFFLILLLGVPFYLAYIRQFSSAALFSPAFFLEIRQGMLEQSSELARTPLVNNLVTLSSIAAVLAFALTESGRRWRLLVAGIVALAFFYNLLTAASAGVVNLLVMLLAIYSMQRGRLPKLALLLALGLVVAFFGVVTAQRALSTGGDIGSLAAAAHTTLEQLGHYLASGPVGFSVYLDHPQSVPAVWSPWRFFERTANYFGNYFDVPNLNAAYVQIGDGLYYNTYTAFFSYFPPYGLSGAAGFMLALGVISGAVYRRARQQRLLWLLLFAPIFYGVLMTIFNESLLLALNPIMKLLIVAAAVVVLRRLRFRRGPTNAALAESRA
ncbi:MAG: O-antigen polymerase [Casimicrobiaceae bacterium]